MDDGLTRVGQLSGACRMHHAGRTCQLPHEVFLVQGLAHTESTFDAIVDGCSIDGRAGKRLRRLVGTAAAELSTSPPAGFTMAADKSTTDGPSSDSDLFRPKTLNLY